MPRCARLLPLLLALALAAGCEAENETAPGNGGPESADPGVDDAALRRDDVSAAAQASFDRGGKQAQAAIAAGEPRIQTLGFPDFSAGELDIDSGLPTENRGCVIDDELAAYVSGWNAEMRRAVAAGELDATSLRSKLTTHAAIEQRFADGDPRTIRTGGDPVTAPGGRFRIEAAPHPTLDSAYLWVVESESGERRELSFFSGAARLLFDHDGGTLLLRDDGYEHYQTFDLASALFMQGFEDT